MMFVLALIALFCPLLAMFYWYKWLADDTIITMDGSERKSQHTIGAPIFVSIVGSASNGSAWASIARDDINVFLGLSLMLLGGLVIAAATFTVSWVFWKLATKQAPPSEEKFGELLRYSPQISEAYSKLENLPDSARQQFKTELMTSKDKALSASGIANKLLDQYDENLLRVTRATNAETVSKYQSMLRSLGDGADEKHLADTIIFEFQNQKGYLPSLKEMTSRPQIGLYEDTQTKHRFRINENGDVYSLKIVGPIAESWEDFVLRFPDMRIRRVK